MALLLLTLYAAAPLLIATLAPRLAGTLGVDALSLRVTHPGLTSLTLLEMRVVSGRTTFTAEGGDLTYGLSGLLGGRLDTVVLERARIDVGAVNGAAAESAKGAGPTADPPLPAELFALLPAKELEIRALTLTVPALDFAANGSLKATPAELHLELIGHTPAEADPFQLNARLTAAGLVSVELQDRQQRGAPLLSVTSTLGADSLAVNGRFDLHGFAFDLAAALAGAPTGTGAVSGQVAGTLPWPLPADLHTAAVRGGGTLQARWRPAPGTAGDTDWEIAEAEAAWNLANGALSGTAGGLLRYGGQDVQFDAAVARMVPTGTEAHGSLAVSAGAAEAPFLDLSWALTPSALTVDGTVDITPPLLESARSLVDLPAGEGALSGTFETLVPRPLSAGIDPLELGAGGSLQGSWQGGPGGVDLPELTGTWTLRERALAAELDARVGYADLQANLGLHLEHFEFGDDIRAAGILHLGSTGSVPFRFRGSRQGGSTLSAQTELDIQRPLAAALLAGWKQPYDLTAGTVRLDADLQWTAAGIANGTFIAGLQNVSAYYDEYTASGAAGELRFSADDGVWSLAPASLTAAAVDTGVALTDISSTVAWRGDTVSVAAATAQLLGGRARAEPFEYALADGAATIVVELEALALPQILALAGDSVSGTGTLDGTVPVELRNNEPSVTDGQVQARPPGGEIQVSPDLAGAAGQPGLDFALRALQEFRYSSLEADVAYSADGDLDLAVRLRGSNPDIEDGRPIHYNLNISQNLPTLLRSLRLQDDVTRGIDRRLQN